MEVFMSRMAEMAVYEEEQENLSGIDDCEYQEYIDSQPDILKDMSIAEKVILCIDK